MAGSCIFLHMTYRASNVTVTITYQMPRYREYQVFNWFRISKNPFNADYNLKMKSHLKISRCQKLQFFNILVTASKQKLVFSSRCTQWQRTLSAHRIDFCIILVCKCVGRQRVTLIRGPFKLFFMVLRSIETFERATGLQASSSQFRVMSYCA